MNEGVQLFADCGYYARRAVTYIENADATCKIEVAIAVNVFQHCAFGARCENWRGVENAARYGGLTTAHQLLRFWAWDWSAKLNCGHFSTIRSALR